MNTYLQKDGAKHNDEYLLVHVQTIAITLMSWFICRKYNFYWIIHQNANFFSKETEWKLSLSDVWNTIFCWYVTVWVVFLESLCALRRLQFDKHWKGWICSFNELSTLFLICWCKVPFMVLSFYISSLDFLSISAPSELFERHTVSWKTNSKCI